MGGSANIENLHHFCLNSSCFSKCKRFQTCKLQESMDGLFHFVLQRLNMEVIVLPYHLRGALGNVFKVKIYLLNCTITLDSEMNDLSLTHKVPLPVGYVCGCVHIQHLEVKQPAVVCPWAKFQVTLLHVEGEPTHVNVTGALQNARGDVLAVTWCIHQHVGVESCIKPLVRTGKRITENNVFVANISSFWYQPNICRNLVIAFKTVFYVKLDNCSKWAQWIFNTY